MSPLSRGRSGISERMDRDIMISVRTLNIEHLCDNTGRRIDSLDLPPRAVQCESSKTPLIMYFLLFHNKMFTNLSEWLISVDKSKDNFQNKMYFSHLRADILVI